MFNAFTVKFAKVTASTAETFSPADFKQRSEVHRFTSSKGSGKMSRVRFLVPDHTKLNNCWFFVPTPGGGRLGTGRSHV